MKPTTRFHNSDPWSEQTSTHPSNHTSSPSSPAETPAATVSSTKLRLMCSNGGHIILRPHDKSLCYIGGETHILVVDRHTTLLNLTRRLSTILRSSSPSKTPANGFPFVIKYQLPSEDLDSLISVITDEDLEHMVDEYDRLNLLNSSSSSSRIRLFVFPTDSDLLTGSGLESLMKSEDWFVNALNGMSLGVSDTSSFSCLLNLDDEISLPEKQDGDQKGIIVGMDLKGNGSGQEVHLIPDSPVMETTTSSFGSTLSTPSLVNLPFISDLNGSNDRAADPNDMIDQTARIQMLQVQNPACLLSMATTQINSPRNQLHHQQPQFNPPPQYIHHHPSGAVPVASYYHHQPYQPSTDQQNFVYYMPARQLPQGYNFPVQQPQPSYDAPPSATAVPSGDQTVLKTELPTGVYRTTNAGASQHVRGPYNGYSDIHQPSQLIYYATQAMPRLSAAHYKNMASMSPFEASLQEQHVRTALP